MGILIQLFAGLLFGVGLVVSGMADPAKVLNFLDLAGSWDPSLLFVMGGAVVVTAIGYPLVRRRGQPLFAGSFQIPTMREIDSRILTGPAIFGIGWGLSGFCPGPAITALALAAPGTLLFFPAMLVGMAVARHLPAWTRPSASNTGPSPARG